MKLKVRADIWWPRLDNCIEEYTSTKNWSRVHIHLMKIENMNILVIVDSTTKWEQTQQKP